MVVPVLLLLVGSAAGQQVDAPQIDQATSDRVSAMILETNRLLQEKRWPELLQKAHEFYPEFTMIYGPQRNEPLHMLGLQAMSQEQMVQWDEARKTWILYLGEAERIAGPKNQWTGQAQYNLAMIEKTRGRMDECISRLEMAEAILETLPAYGHQHLTTLYELARLNAACKKWDVAEDACDRAFRRQLQTIANEPRRLSIEGLERTLETDVIHLGYTLARRRSPEAGRAARYAEWHLNLKGAYREAFAREMTRLNGITANEIARPTDRKQQEKITEAVEAARELKTARRKIAGLLMRPTPPGISREEIKARMKEIEKAFFDEKGQANLAAQVGPTADDARDAWVTLDQVREGLAPDALLIDLVGFNEFDFAAKLSAYRPFKADRTGAFVIPPKGKGEVKFVDLGTDAPLDAAVGQLAQLIDVAIAGGMEDEVKAEAQFKAAARAVTQKLFKPLLPHLKGAKTLIVSPQGSTWLIPWAALVLDDGRYAVENYTISYLSSGRDLIAAGHAPTSNGVVSIFANPDYDRGATEAQKGKGPFTPLPGTAEEARVLPPLLEKYTGKKPFVILGENAQEYLLLGTERPRLLILSTHGFFGPIGDSILFSRNPLVRCGVALAGANPRVYDSEKTFGFDGVVTGLEILGMDLKGTDLVILSACETALGEVQAAQDLLGLRLAFHLAGAKNVVATLWPISDKETVGFMTNLIQNLIDGKSKPEALRQAQLAMIAEHRKRKKAAHPVFWSPFVLTEGAGLTRPR